MRSLRSVSGPQARVVRRLALIVALVALAALALSGAADSVHTGLLTMLPALTLGVMMLTRPYLGAGAIARLRARRLRRRAHGADSTLGLLRPGVGVACGGRLIAMALAGRAPPLALAGCR